MVDWSSHLSIIDDRVPEAVQEKCRTVPVVSGNRVSAFHKTDVV